MLGKIITKEKVSERRRSLGAFIALFSVVMGVVWLAWGPEQRGELSYVAWGGAKSLLVDWRGLPLFAADWSGRNLPYTIKGEDIVPALRNEVAESYPDFDFFQPAPLSDDLLVMEGREKEKPAKRDLFLYDDKKVSLSNITETTEIDESSHCINLGKGLISWSEDRQIFARLIDRKVVKTGSFAEPFSSCLWIDEHQMIGLQKREKLAKLFVCSLGQPGTDIVCRASSVLDPFENAGKLFRTTPGHGGISVRRKGDVFRQAWNFDAALDRLELYTNREILGDVLEVDSDVLRVGFMSRYFVPGYQTKTDAVHHSILRTGEGLFSIYSDPVTPKTLARWSNNHWIPYRNLPVRILTGIALPKEVLIGDRFGEVHQAFYFGSEDARQVVIWWHGGQVNTSPRYDPYFHFLNRHGWGVLAVNYPGSVGRGAAYESGFENPRFLYEVTRATLRYLEERGVRRIVSWSVSGGVRIQNVILKANMKVSAIVSHDGSHLNLRRGAAMQKIPYFAIAGRYDKFFDGSPMEYTYLGGHDLEDAKHFEKLTEAMIPFLSSLPELPEQAHQYINPVGTVFTQSGWGG